MRNKQYSILIISFAILLLPLSGFIPKPVWARESNNIVGVNLACLWNPGMVPEIVDLVTPGGWMVIMALPGDAQPLQELLDELDAHPNNGVNLIIRVDKHKQSFTPDDAKAWVATLGKLETDRKIFVIPWNEPNYELPPGSGQWFEAEDLWGASQQEVANRVNQYSDAFIQHLNDSGLRGDRVVLLSPALNQSHSNYFNFLKDLDPSGQGKNFYEKFDGIAMNLYDFWTNTNGPPLTHSEKHLNAGRYREFLNDLGVDPNMPVFAVESGAVLPGEGVVYRDQPIQKTIAAAVENNLYQQWKDNVNFNMFAVFSYDPEHEEDWRIFDNSIAGATRAYFQDLGTRLGGSIAQGGSTPADFGSWLGSQSGIVACPDGIGYAPDIDLCLYTCGGGIRERRTIQAIEVDEALTDSILLQQPGINSTGFTPPGAPPLDPLEMTITRGGIFQNFADLEIPFLPTLADYLAGPYMYKSPTAIKEAQTLTANSQQGYQPWLHGALANLLPRQAQDNLRYEYWKNCYNGYFIPIECFVADEDNRPFPIQNIPEPPNKEEIFASENTDWRAHYLDLWNQIPLVDDPLVRTGSLTGNPEDKAIKADCCPNYQERTSNIITEIPYLYGINKAAELLHAQWMPVITASTSLPPTLEEDPTLSCYENYQEENPVCDPNQPPENECLRIAETTPGLPIEIKGTGGNEPWTAFYGPTEDLRCTWEFDHYDPVLRLNYYRCQDNPDFNNNPIRSRVAFPYLSNIYQNLSGPEGFFRILMSSELASNWEDNPDEIGKWDAYTASHLNYCFEPAPTDPSHPLAGFFPLTIADQGEIKQYNDFANPPPPGVCDVMTTNLSVYIPYLGGVTNAAEWAGSRPTVPAALLKSQ
jgi:hypothetical protein